MKNPTATGGGNHVTATGLSSLDRLGSPSPEEPSRPYYTLTNIDGRVVCGGPLEFVEESRLSRIESEEIKADLTRAGMQTLLKSAYTHRHRAGIYRSTRTLLEHYNAEILHWSTVKAVKKS